MAHSRQRNKSGVSKTQNYKWYKTFLFPFFFQLVNCPRGHFFNGSSCRACAVDQYQDQEAQISCISCPLGTTTFGEEASEKMQDCQGKEISKKINNDDDDDDDDDNNNNNNNNDT